MGQRNESCFAPVSTVNGHRAESTVTQGAEIHSINEIEEMPNEIGITVAIESFTCSGCVVLYCFLALPSAFGYGSTIGTSNAAGATLPFFQSGNDTVTFALPLPASSGTPTGP
jgi:hypothetical protein